MQRCIKLLALMVTTIGIAACGDGKASIERGLLQATDSFSTYYFNWQFHKARNFSTQESEPWLRLVASQLTQQDADLLNSREEKASSEVANINYVNDSTAQVLITIHHYLRLDSIGREPHSVEKGTFVLQMVYQNAQKRWLANLNGVPREEKHASE